MLHASLASACQGETLLRTVVNVTAVIVISEVITMISEDLFSLLAEGS